jgi:hypothetical protein
MLEEVQFRLKGMVWLVAVAMRRVATDAFHVLEARGRLGHRAGRDPAERRRSETRLN